MGIRTEIAREDFENFRALIRGASGISLGDSKDALLTSRIGRRMRELGVDSHGDYYRMVVDDPTNAELQCLIDAISTNVTSFFREREHFHHLSAHLSRLLASGRAEARLWSAACATGEEPYSMAMTALETIGSQPMRVKILATDISTGVLTTAQTARYPAGRAHNVPRELASKWLEREVDGSSRVALPARSLVTFSPINLSRPPFPMRGPFDVIFCRNVMIYFRPDTRQALVSELERLLAPGGLLMLGSAESLTGLQHGLRPLAPAVYEKAGR